MIKETKVKRCAHGGRRCNNGGLDIQCARMWTFHILVTIQNEGGRTYLDYTNPPSKMDFLGTRSGTSSSINI
jgi:hypothetical protein